MNHGSVRKGAGNWLLERATAIALIPLTVWFVAALIAHTGSDYAALIAWLRKPFVAISMVLLLIALFWHTALGLGVVIKDYVHAINQRTVTLIAMRLVCFGLTAAGVVTVLGILFSG
ncbi:MAG: succinate dehydrogenase, hydrophobic membrane anchor protein [Rhodanobacteraceae bacterium]